jgi:predicted nucleic-acid-binding protein
MANRKVMLDTNAVLRFIVDDDKEKSNKVSDLITTADCIVSIEVIAETVYNLEKYYGHLRQFIAEEIKDFIRIKENLVFEENVIHYGCNIYASTRLDFIDCLLVGYANVKDSQIFTFDADLKEKLGHKAQL